MLRSLHIKNYALIEELTLEFEQGLNIITGETGAGKSIIIDALGLLLGDRSDADSVRKGAEKTIVEGVLVLQHRQKKLDEVLIAGEIACEDELILRREVSAKGQSRAFINDSPVTLAMLKQVGDLLVDLHGQHEHQSLLRSETHVDLLDDFGGLTGLVAEYHTSYRNTTSLRREMDELHAREAQLMERRSLHEFQLKEIDAVDPRAGEEDQLETELRILENAERLFSTTERLYQMLHEGDDAVHDRLVLARNELGNLSAIDASFGEPRNEAASAAAIVDELAKFIQQYNSKIEFSPERLDSARDRLGHLSLLKKKYGGSLDAVIHHRETIRREVALAENFSLAIEELHGKFRQARKITSEIAQRLSTKRREIGRRVNRSIVTALSELGIMNAVFETQIVLQPSSDSERAIIVLGKDAFEASPKGMDIVEFHISTNVGEDVKPLTNVASGGEISRIMLALKMILAKSDRLPLLVFDEIDVGVSGRIAQAVGRSLKQLSQFHQVVAITHLPQIAGLADTHFVVEKAEDGKRSKTQVRKLDVDARVAEVAKLMSGEEVTQSGLRSARELMGLN